MAKHATFDDWLVKRLANDPEQAAELLRVALEEADDDPRGLSLYDFALHHHRSWRH